jgi:hypothetical protein
MAFPKDPSRRSISYLSPEVCSVRFSAAPEVRPWEPAWRRSSWRRFDSDLNILSIVTKIYGNFIFVLSNALISLYKPHK